MEKLTSDEPGFVSLVVLVELHWLLRRAYGLSRANTTEVFRKFLSSAELVIQESEVVHRALCAVESNIDFPDALIAELGHRYACVYTVTFNKAAGKLSGMKILK